MLKRASSVSSELHCPEQTQLETDSLKTLNHRVKVLAWCSMQRRNNLTNSVFPRISYILLICHLSYLLTRVLTAHTQRVSLRGSCHTRVADCCQRGLSPLCTVCGLPRSLEQGRDKIHTCRIGPRGVFGAFFHTLHFFSPFRCGETDVACQVLQRPWRQKPKVVCKQNLRWWGRSPQKSLTSLKLLPPCTPSYSCCLVMTRFGWSLRDVSQNTDKKLSTGSVTFWEVKWASEDG